MSGSFIATGILTSGIGAFGQTIGRQGQEDLRAEQYYLQRHTNLERQMNLYQQKGYKGLAILVTVISIIPAAYASFPMLTGMGGTHAPAMVMGWASLIGLTALFSVMTYSFIRTLCWLVNGFEDKGNSPSLYEKGEYRRK